MYKEVIGNIWDFKDDIKVITTNGFVKMNGELVMGRGTALQLAKKYPKTKRYEGVKKELGFKVSNFGNHCFYLDKINIITFPVKYKWYENANINLIKSSILELIDLCHKFKIKKIIMTRVGCGNGKLNWNYVKNNIKDSLENSDIEFIIVNTNTTLIQ